MWPPFCLTTSWQTNPCIRHNFSTHVFRKRAAQLHYVGPELRYIFWPPGGQKMLHSRQHSPHSAHISPTDSHHNSYNRTDNYRQWNTVGSPDDGHKYGRNMLRYYWLPINHYLFYLVGLTFIYLHICNSGYTSGQFIFTWVIEWGSVVIFRSQEGSWEKKSFGNTDVDK